MTRALCVSLVMALCLVACKPSSGLNTRCQLPRRSDGGTAFLTEGQVQESTQSNKDFIAFGAVDCESFICVRDSTFPKGADLSAPAEGYCSNACQDETSQCPSDNSVSTFDKDPAKAMRCRALLLDKETLAALPPGTLPIAGGQPFFCARGFGGADAGK